LAVSPPSYKGCVFLSLAVTLQSPELKNPEVAASEGMHMTVLLLLNTPGPLALPGQAPTSKNPQGFKWGNIDSKYNNHFTSPQPSLTVATIY